MPSAAQTLSERLYSRTHRLSFARERMALLVDLGCGITLVYLAQW